MNRWLQWMGTCDASVACVDCALLTPALLPLLSHDSHFAAYDRSLLHPYPTPPFDFTYHGHNPYAYPIAKYGNTTVSWSAASIVPTYDFVSIQLYESWSHADYNTSGAPVALRQSPSDYLINWVPRVLNGWTVNFSQDPPSGLPDQVVSLLPSQLVIGLANAWAGNAKSLLIMPEDVGIAYRYLNATGQAPRGFVFWTICNEGDTPANQTQPLYMAAEINDFLHTRP